MLDYETQQAVQKVAEAVMNAINNRSSGYDSGTSSQLMQVNSTLNSIDSELTQLNTTLMGLVGSAKPLLETTVIAVLQAENAKVTAENTKLMIRQRQILMLISDLGSVCLGCKKAKWSPHAADCDFGPAFTEVLQGVMRDAEADDDRAAEGANGGVPAEV